MNIANHRGGEQRWVLHRRLSLSVSGFSMEGLRGAVVPSSKLLKGLPLRGQRYQSTTNSTLDDRRLGEFERSVLVTSGNDAGLQMPGLCSLKPLIINSNRPFH
jgi:hypothetical protein